LLSLRQADGRFHGRYSAESGRGDGEPSPYSDGETLLALAKAAGRLARDDLRPVVLESAEAMHRVYVVEARRADPDSPLTKGFYQWGTMAYFELYEAGWADTERYARRAIELAHWMIDVHRTLSRPRNTAYAHEGLISAWELARRIGDGRSQEKIGRVIEEGLCKLTSWQVGGPNPCEFLRRHPTADPQKVGGVMGGQDDPWLRIDVTQHQMHAVILARRYMYRQE
jgi:UDP-N-acetylmuramoyl-tripeptide--D-alanyl-D-alanine ligase